MEKKALVVANPIAGKAKINRIINKIRDNIVESGFDVNIKYTTESHNATESVKDYEHNYDVLFVCGGDGTLNEVMQAICELGKNIPIAYMPVGTTNDFAKSLGVPFSKKLSKNIDLERVKKVDIGKFNEHYFNYVVSTGLFSKTSYQTTSKMKNRYGRLAYLVTGAKEIFTCEPQKLKIHLNDEIVEDDFMYCSVSNSIYIGGFNLFRKHKEVKLDDGEFEVILVKAPKNFFGLMNLIIKMIGGSFKSKNILYFKAKELTIESDKYMEWSIDGEYSGMVNDIHIENIHQHAQYVMPSKKSQKST